MAPYEHRQFGWVVAGITGLVALSIAGTLLSVGAVAIAIVVLLLPATIIVLLRRPDDSGRRCGAARAARGWDGPAPRAAGGHCGVSNRSPALVLRLWLAPTGGR